MENVAIKSIEPMLLTVTDVCNLLNVKRATFYKIKASGAFAPLEVGLCRKVLYNRLEIEKWIGAGCPHRRPWQIIKGQK
jgi:predicted DNA-binding transcriptional regulator AlpA